MKRLLFAAATLSLALTSSLAAAQDWHGHGDRDFRGEHNRDRHGDGDHRGDYRGDRDGRDGYHGGHWNDHDRGGHYARGQRYRGDGAYLSDYRRYGYRAPPRGYRYYRANNGDVLLAAIATGIITSVIVSGHNGY